MSDYGDNDDNENSDFKEFGPITPDDKSHGYGSFFSNFFKRNKNKAENEGSPKKSESSKQSLFTQVEAGANAGVKFEAAHASNVKVLTSEHIASQACSFPTTGGVETLSHERTLPNVLKRIKNIADKRGATPQQYRDADFKQFWLPDHLSKGCYDCSEKYTPLRRRHHCRICGQIFCSKCCNRIVPGKILGYKGEFRVCTYCYKVVFCCLKTNNFDEDVLADLNVFEEDLISTKVPTTLSASEGISHLSSDVEKKSVYDKRKKMYGFMEENYTIRSRKFSSNFASCVDQKQLEQIASERQLLLKDSQQLQSLWSMMVSGPNKLPLSTNRHRIKSVPDSFIGRDFVQWLLNNDKASSRQSAVAIGQALLEAGFIVGMSETDQFVDEHALFKIKADALDNRSPVSSVMSNAQDMGKEPLWLEQMSSNREKSDETSTPQKIISGRAESGSSLNISSSSSVYSLDLNIKESVVSLKNPLKKSDVSNEGGNSGLGDPETSVSAVLNDTIRSILSEQNSTGAVMTEEVLEALKSLEPKLAESIAAGWQIKNEHENFHVEEPVDEQTKMSLATKKGFNEVWRRYENRLLLMLLRANDLDISWCRTILPFIYKVVETVHPDVKNESDDMDIRQYIQFKKVPGGEVSECRIVNGTVCTKNITQSQMKSQLTDPQILIIASHIDYNRSSERNRENTVQNNLKQEEAYTKNVVAKIMMHKPDIVITKDGASYMTRELLLAEGVTVVMNVKTSVIDRIARCTQAQVIPSVEDLVAANASSDLPHFSLGMCHSFYINSFNIPKNHLPKHLMYFDGCATHLGCTIILRGATNMELTRVKRVMSFMIFALYNWKLERSYMMDIFASVPSLESNVCNVIEEGEEIEKESEGKEDNENHENKKDRPKKILANTSIKTASPTEAAGSSNQSSSKVTEVNLVSDNSDPLRCYLGTSPSEKPENFDKESLLADTNLIPFSTALDNSVLSVSPYIKYDVPFLLSKEGKTSPLRKFFIDDLYYSNSFYSQLQPKKTVFQDPLPKKPENKNVEFKSSHSFITSKLTKPASDLAVRTALADYRARGNAIRYVCECKQEGKEPAKELTNEEIRKLIDKNGETEKKKEERRKENLKKFEYTSDGKIDALHPYNHQRISILFSNFSQSFHYTSAFCVNPRVLTMAFYGRNDITLGSFLERYCFNSNYNCLSDSCQAPIVDHVRKFVHEGGCIEILLRKMDSSLDELNSSTIYMWTWCKECRQVSPVVPMSSDTWTFSFAKYLELRFHDSNISRRGNPGCSHSIHQDHFHYFGQMDMVAILKYTTIPTLKLVLPPTEIYQTLNTLPHSYFVETIKAVAIQGYGVFSSIVDRLSTVSEEIGLRWDPLLESVAMHHQQQKKLFRENIENVQMQLTSPALEDHWSEFSSPNTTKEHSALVFAISDQLVRIKCLVVQVVLDWNGKVEDLMKLRKKEEREKFRTNSGTVARQSQLSSVSSTLAGSAEQLHIATKDDTVFRHPETFPSENPNETFSGEEKSEVSLEENKKSPQAANEDLSSENAASKRSAENEKEDKISDHQSIQNFALRLQKEKDSIIKALDELDDVSTSPISTVHYSRSPAEVISSTGLGHACFSNSATEKDVSGGIHAVLASQSDEHVRKRKISTSSMSVRSGLEQFIPSKSCHERSLSDDGEVAIAKEAVEKIPEKRYSSSVKNIISKVLSSSEDLKIKSPFDPSEHFNLLPEVKIPVVIHDNEPSSIIAIALASQEYETKLHLLQKRLKESPQGMETKGLETQSSSSPSVSRSVSQEGQPSPSGKINDLERLSQKDFHIDLQWSDQSSNYYCMMLYVEQFRQLRQLIYPLGEDHFIRSLSRCNYWDARGGKSGSSFRKTSDDRFVLKEMSRIELNSFLEFAPSYIQYIMNCKKYNIPTALARIVGVYRIGFKNTVTNKGTKLDVLVMENLFYQRCLKQKFDLKGSERNRKVNLTGKEESEVVLLDENLMQMACSRPFYLQPHGKDVLTRAVTDDSAFLAQHFVMDYSLLVGEDVKNNELIVGIIDYIRTFTWDKKLETMIKGGVLGTGKLPTVVSPEIYNSRFCLAMESYFVLAPDRWSGLGVDIETT